MTVIFLKLLNLSISAGWLVLAILLLRPVMRRTPRWISCLLWGVAALRLVIPVSIPSFFSLQPSAQVIPQNIATSQTPAIYSGIHKVNEVVNPLLTGQLIRGVDLRERVLLIAAAVWLTGMVLMLLYSMISYLNLHRQVRVSVRQQDNVYICDDVDQPFLLGLFRPKIYLPSNLSERQKIHVLAHENAHIRRKDHWWKPLGFALLSVYWFNPLLWVAYILLCRDIERACDEKVIAPMDVSGKRDYADALLSCSIHRRTIMVCPVAFGEVSIKERIKGIARYRKPAIWIVAVSLLACALMGMCFLTDPMPCAHKYQGQITVSPTCTQKGMQTHTCTRCDHSYTTPVALAAHSYDNGTVTVLPTCTREGSKILTCTGCGKKTTQTVEKLPHTAGVLTVAKEPNCTETGEATSACTVCQTVFVAQILETNDVHDLKQTVTKEATCTAEGSAVNACTRCDHKETYAIEQLKHTYKVISETLPAICTDQGERVLQCSACGHEKKEILPAGEHVMRTLNVYWPDRCLVCGYTAPRSGGSDLVEDVYQDKVTGDSGKLPEDLFPVIKWDLGAP